MEALIQAATLKEAVKQAGKTTGGKSSYMPILQGVKIETKLDGLEISGTNLESCSVAKAEGLTYPDSGPSSVIVDARILAKLTGKLSGEVFVSSAVGTLTVGGAVIPTMELEDFPELPESKGGQIVGVFEGGVFKQLTKRLKAAAKPKTSTLASLTGALVSYREGRVKFAATDGYRLLLEEFESVADCAGSILVPASELAKIATIAKKTDIVRLEVIAGDPARLAVSFASVSYQLRGINETFPDFERVIPSGNGVRFTIGRKVFREAIARGQIVASQLSGAVTLSLTYGSSALELSSGCTDLGYYSENVRLSDTVWDTCEPVAINGGYMADVLKLGSSLSVSVTLGSRLQAALFTTDGDNVSGRTRQAWVLMPVDGNS